MIGILGIATYLPSAVMVIVLSRSRAFRDRLTLEEITPV
jgi:hypothetical protein